MAIYVFSLLVNYELSGVDHAQGIRSSFLRKTNQSVKYIFTDLPGRNDIKKYKELGIEQSEMLSAHFFISGHDDLSGNCRVSEKLDELKDKLEITKLDEKEGCIDLYRDEQRVASIILKEKKDFFSEILYLDREKMIASEYYTDRLVYTDFYSTVQKNGKLYAKRVRSSFVDKKGRKAYDCLYDIDGQELYVYPDGITYTKRQLLEQFIKMLSLSEKDIVIVDRPSFFDYVQPLWEYGNKARFVTFLHSGHYYKKGEDTNALYLNYEYYNWFKYSEKIDLILVSTEGQKRDLEEKLRLYQCKVPRIEVIPVSGLDKLRFPEKDRKRCSLLTVSRLQQRKKIDWLITSVIKAHEKNSDISLDIYGKGVEDYVLYLKEIVAANHAEHYIRFMGYCNVSEVYQNYEAYITTSLWETFGLSTMEAIGSGNAVIGFNVRYGNQVFIDNAGNGKLVDFSLEYMNNPEKTNEMVSEMADAIVECFQDEKRLKKYRKRSYEIAEQFLNKKIERRWIDVINSVQNVVRKKMVYNFNLGIGWASSGVEYAQAYRANMLRKIGANAKFVFMDMFPQENIQHMTENIGFLDSEVIWLYTFFTDCKIAPVSYTLEQLEKTFGGRSFTFSREGKIARYIFEGNNNFYTAYMVDDTSDRVHRVEMVSNGFLIRKDFFTYCRIYSEYYAPLDKKAHLYQRRFFNEDGTVAYEEITDNDVVMYQFPDRLICSKEELVGYMVSKLNLTENDVVIIDRTTGIGQAILQNAAPAKVGIIIHADHFSEGATDEENILWNNYYEYAFSQHKHIDFYVTATDDQNRLLKKQFLKYVGATPNVVTIPVGSLDELKYSKEPRKPYSLITASRLATEKHVDWLIEAVVEARKQVPEISLDIYGKGGEEEKLKELIHKFNCGNYVKLCGQQNLNEVYKHYEAYLSGSTSEGFGLTLLEAIGSGLPIIGFDVRYGNQNFIDDGQNGYKIPVHDKMDSKERIRKLTECIIRLFTEADMEAFHEHSYEKANTYLTTEVEKRWATTVNQAK